MTKLAAGHLESVHLLRGFAALWVAILHAIGWFGCIGVLDPHNRMGQWGVVVFFVISGFVLPLSLDAQYKLLLFPKFLAKRLIRIEPTYLVSMLVAVIIMVIKTRLAPQGTPWVPDIGQIAAHFMYVIPFTHYTWFNEVYWTLAIEFQYYVVIGLMFPLFRRASQASPWLMGTGVVLFACLTLAAKAAPQIGLLPQAPYFALGLLAYDLYRNPQRWSFALGIGIVLAAIGIWQELEPVQVLLGFAAAVLIVYWRPSLSSWRWLGTISYSLYVIHYPVVIVINQIAHRLFTGSFLWLNYLASVFAILISLGLAWVLYRYVEGPTQRLSKSIKYT